MDHNSIRKNNETREKDALAQALILRTRQTNLTTNTASLTQIEVGPTER